MAFYEVYLTIQEEKGDKDKMKAAKDEAENYFNISFPLFKFKQDNRIITSDKNNNAITNSLSSIKGFGNAISEVLYEVGDSEYDSFVVLLFDLNEKGVKTSKIEPLIKIGYFSMFGNCVELLRINEFFDIFKQGSAKTIKKAAINNEDLLEILSQYASDKNAKSEESESYTITSDKIVSIKREISKTRKEIKTYEKREEYPPECLTMLLSSQRHDYEAACQERAMQCLITIEKYIKSINMNELSIKTMMANQLDILGYINLTTNKEEDRRKLLVTDLVPLKNKDSGEIWGYATFTQSIGSGKSSRLTVKAKAYKQEPFNKMDIVYAKSVEKNPKGYWYLIDYERLF